MHEFVFLTQTEEGWSSVGDRMWYVAGTQDWAGSSLLPKWAPVSLWGPAFPSFSFPVCFLAPSLSLLDSTPAECLSCLSPFPPWLISLLLGNLAGPWTTPENHLGRVNNALKDPLVWFRPPFQIGNLHGICIDDITRHLKEKLIAVSHTGPQPSGTLWTTEEKVTVQGGKPWRYWSVHGH